MNPLNTSKSTARRRLIPLVVVNAVLLLVLISSLTSPFVQAGLGGRRGSFLMVAGEGERAATNLVWILESRNGELISVDWLDAGQGMKAKAHRNIQADIESIIKSR